MPDIWPFNTGLQNVHAVLLYTSLKKVDKDEGTTRVKKKVKHICSLHKIQNAMAGLPYRQKIE